MAGERPTRLWLGLVLLAPACAGGEGKGRTGTATDAESVGSQTSTGTMGNDATTADSTGPGSSSGAGGDCGNGIPESGEECDEGPNNAETGECLPGCIRNVCGDGFVLEGTEACDDGNDDETDGCTTLCEAPACDDGIKSGDETDVDCGGGCAACVAGQDCDDDGDCENQVCQGGICAPAASCLELVTQHRGLSDGLYSIDPNGGESDDAVEVFCDMTTDGGGWTAIAANGDISIAETTDPDDCYPLITGDEAAGCGESNELFNDFSLRGDQQAALSWQSLLGIAYGDAGYGDKLAFFAIDFGSPQPTADERFNGTSFVPTGITTTHGKMACTGFNIVHYARAGTYNPNAAYIADGVGTVFGHDSDITMNSSVRKTFGFTDATAGAATQSGVGIDDYQDGWSCSDMWVPQAVRGARMVVLVR